MSQGCWNRATACAVVVAGQCLGAILLYGVPEVCAQRLSVRHYDARDGLAQSNVRCLYQDAKGYLAFTILPPLWQRWWFVALVVAAARGRDALYWLAGDGRGELS